MTSISAEAARRIAGSVPDPELPVVTVAELGILREVTVEGERLVVTLTPTYSGCPALPAIARDVHRRLTAAGAPDPEIRVALRPPWTTDWITHEGRRKLREAGIAPPGPARAASGPTPVALTVAPRRVACPQCGSLDTILVSPFSATACTAAHRCRSCGEPFDRVKEL